MITIVELAGFQAQVGVCIRPSERDDVIDFLARNPERGDPIIGTGGIRKLRWGGKGKGKRCGLRIIYYFYNEASPIFLLTAYAKGEKEDLSSEQIIQLTSLTKVLKMHCKNRRTHP